MSEPIVFDIQNNTGGSIDIILFYSCEGATASVSWSLDQNAISPQYTFYTSEFALAEYWSLSLFVKAGSNAGYYSNVGCDVPDWTNWNEYALDEGTYTFTVDTSTFSFNDGDGGQFGVTQRAPRPDTSRPAISHVFVVMLENRSFDHMLAFSNIPNITAATTADSNTYMIMDEATRAVAVERVSMVGPQTCNVRVGNPSPMLNDPGHEFPDVVMQLGGEFASFDPNEGYPAIDNSGFLASYATSTTEAPYHPPTTTAQLDMIMTSFDPSDLPVLTALATNYAVCDHWFSSMPGPTWPNRFFLHAASSAGFDHSPSTYDMAYWETPGDAPLTFTNGTIFDQLYANRIPYSLYQDRTDDGTSYYNSSSGVADASGAVPQATAILPSVTENAENFFWELSGLAADLQGPYPYPYTFIEPHYGDISGGTYEGGSSQHPMDQVYGGENLLAGVYDAISASPYWKSSLLLICYDEHGGFYDKVAPPRCHAPGDETATAPDGSSANQYGFDFTQLGVRVPAVLVSPLISPKTVCKTPFDHSSLSKMLSQLWGTSTLTNRDANANSPFDVTSMWQATPSNGPIALSPLPPPTPPNLSLQTDRAARLTEPLPDSGNEIGALIVLRKIDFELSDGSDVARRRILERVKGIRTRGDLHAYAHEVFEKQRQWRKARRPSVRPMAPAEP